MSSENGESNGSKLRGSKLLIVLLVIALALLLAVAVFFLTFGAQLLRGESYETRSPAEYGVYEGHIEQESALVEQFSQLLIFPKTLTSGAQVNDFYYACSTKGLDNSYQLLLDYQLPADEFQDEVERLRALSVSYNGQTHRAIYDTENYPLPAYVTVYTKSGNREFALIDEKNHRIIAILAMGGQGSLDKELFPKTGIEYEGGTDWYGYSIYDFETADGVMEGPV
jgi:flagellar basal body-associated protein FliL